MNLKLAKKIRQGIREMAGIERPGLAHGFVHPGPGRQKPPMFARYPEDYEGEIQRKRDGSLWQTESVDGDGTKTFSPTRIAVRLKLQATRQIYKRAKRMVV